MNEHSAGIALQLVQRLPQVLMWSFCIVVALVARAVLPAYLRKKGENLADVQDVALIAELGARGAAPIERALAAVRVTYGAAAASETTLRERRDQALIGLYRKAALLLGDRLIVNHGDFPMDAGASLGRHRARVAAAFADVRVAYYDAVLHVGQARPELSNAIRKLIDASWQLNKAFNKHFIGVRISHIEFGEEVAKVGAGQVVAATEAIDRAESAYRDGMRPFAEEFMRCFDGYMSELSIHLGGQGLSELPKFD